MNQVFNKSSVRAIIGLGNPGSRFVHTRHNIGFRIVEYLADKYAGVWKLNSNLEYAPIKPPSLSHEVILIKPLTFMNESGRVTPFLTKKGIKPEEVIVVHDELEKKFTAMTISQGGSPRGHNGIKSLQALLGTSFWRLRFGIDRPTTNDRDTVGSYVLGSFTQEEEASLNAAIEKAASLLIS